MSYLSVADTSREAFRFRTAGEWERSDEGRELLRGWLVAAFQIGTPYEPYIPLGLRPRLIALRERVEREHAEQVARQKAQAELRQVLEAEAYRQTLAEVRLLRRFG